MVPAKTHAIYQAKYAPSQITPCSEVNLARRVLIYRAAPATSSGAPAIRSACIPWAPHK